MLASFLDTIRDGNMIAPRRMAERLRVPMTYLSRLAHINRNTLAAQPGSPAVQEKLGQIARIITRAAEISGDEGRAIIWFRHQPLAGFGNRTPEELVEAGLVGAVLEDLERMSEGVYG